MKKTVYGIGLPRTGMTSLARALRILGYDGANHCRLTGASETDSAAETERVFRIDNGFHEMYQALYHGDPEGYFVLTVRDPAHWRDSLARFDHNLDLPDMTAYRREVERFFEDQGGRLLVLNLLTRDDHWTPLCEFLGEPAPDMPFPQRLAEDHIGEGI